MVAQRRTKGRALAAFALGAGWGLPLSVAVIVAGVALDVEAFAPFASHRVVQKSAAALRALIDTETEQPGERLPDGTVVRGSAERLVCPTLPTTAVGWEPSSAAKPPLEHLPASKGLEKRIAFWEKVWGEVPNFVYLLVDERRPWVVHGEVDCRDLFDAEERSVAKADCGSRISKKLVDIRRGLKKGKRGPSDSLIAAYDGDVELARSAARNLYSVEGRKGRLEDALERAAPSLDALERIFAESGAPPMLARLAFVESLFIPEATSRSGAVGAYQFMAPTGREFLLIDEHVDERLDPLRSGWAAATYLARNHKRFDEWPLAVTAYNTGPTRLARMVKRHGTTDLADLVELPADDGFGFDGQNYYASMVAVARVTSNFEAPEVAMEQQSVTLTSALTLADAATCLSQPLLPLIEENPALDDAAKKSTVEIPAGYRLSLPSVRVGPATASRFAVGATSARLD